MQRILFNLAALVSLALCAAVIGLWVRSYHCGDFVTRYRSGTYRQIASCRGQLYIQTGPTSYADGIHWTVQYPGFFYLNAMATTDWQILGFSHVTAALLNGVPGRHFSVLDVPLWCAGASVCGGTGLLGASAGVAEACPGCRSMSRMRL